MLTAAQYTLTLGTATLVCAPHEQWQRVTLHNASKSSNNYVYIGAQNVTTTTGLHIDEGGTLQLELYPREEIWAVSDPGGIVLHVIRQTN
jgi:hypothetical protein